MFTSDKTRMVSAEQALPGRSQPMQIKTEHYTFGASMQPPYPDGMQQVLFGLGCFWGAERRFWQQPGVYTTAVGYSAGFTPNPSYEEVCTGLTGHNEVVLVVYDPAQVSFAQLLKVFWESHNPTQGMRQGNDIGTQYRSGIYAFTQSQLDEALHSRQCYQQRLAAAGFAGITTEIRMAGPFYFAEDYHQQYLAKNPLGYCGLGGCGVSYGG